VATDWHTATATLRLSAALVEGIQSGLATRGFDDVRPVHGFAFAALSGGDTTTSGLAAALGITKQAAAQLVDHLVARGYVTRVPAPHDGRARVIVLTERGHACTAAAEQAAAAVVDGWRRQLDPTTFDTFTHALGALAAPGRLRPIW
jgi:DNA-binding MarR family transcriptional regulator